MLYSRTALERAAANLPALRPYLAGGNGAYLDLPPVIQPVAVAPRDSRHPAAAWLLRRCRALAGPPLGDLIALAAAPIALRLGISATTCRCSARRAWLNRHTTRLEALLWLIAASLTLARLTL